MAPRPPYVASGAISSAQTFYLHLKECEYRFNNRNESLYRELLKLLRKNPL
jgi:transposase